MPVRQLECWGSFPILKSGHFSLGYDASPDHKTAFYLDSITDLYIQYPVNEGTHIAAANNPEKA